MNVRPQSNLQHVPKPQAESALFAITLLGICILLFLSSFAFLAWIANSM